jgi:hypothetical protein
MLDVDLFTVQSFTTISPELRPLITETAVRRETLAILSEALARRGKSDVRVAKRASDSLASRGTVTLRVYVSVRATSKDNGKDNQVILAAAIQPLRFGYKPIAVVPPAPPAAAIATRDADSVATQLRAVLLPGLDELAEWVNKPYQEPPAVGIEIGPERKHHQDQSQ